MGNCFLRLISRAPGVVIEFKQPISDEQNSENSPTTNTSSSSSSLIEIPSPQSNLFTVNTLAGDGSIHTRDGTGKDCGINWPYEIKFDSSGNGIFTAYGSASVRKITPDGKVTTISDRLSESGDTFHCVRGLALDKKNNIYIADTGNNAIRKISSDGSSCDTIKTDTDLSNPYGITVAEDGIIYISDSYADRIVAINPANGRSEVIAGGTNNGYSDGAGKDAKFSLPQGIQIDPEGNLIVADSKNNAIRKIDKQRNVSTIATGFKSPYGVTIDKRGNIYVADYGNNAIKVIDKQGRIRPIIGDYPDGPNSLNMPTGMDIDPNGNIVICDCYNHVLRKVNCVFVRMAEIWPKSHQYLPRPVSQATEELCCVLSKAPPVPSVPKELILIMVTNLIEIWPF